MPTINLSRFLRAAGTRMKPNAAHWTDAAPTIYPRVTPDSAFAKAAQIVDRRDGHAMMLARTMGAGWLFTAVISAGLGLGWYQQAERSTVQVVIVPVDKLGEPGEVRVAGDLTTTKEMQAWAVREFVRSVFGRSSDPNVNRERLQHAIASADGHAVKTFNAWERAGGNKDVDAREIAIVSVKQTLNPAIWAVTWDAREWHDGAVISLGTNGWTRMHGDFRLEHRPPKNVAELGKNPFGLFVVDLTFAPETRPEDAR